MDDGLCRARWVGRATGQVDQFLVREHGRQAVSDQYEVCVLVACTLSVRVCFAMLPTINNARGDFGLARHTGRLPLGITKAASVLNRAHPARLAKAVRDQSVGTHAAQTVGFDTRLGVVAVGKGDDFAVLDVAQEGARVTGGCQLIVPGHR